MAKDANIGNDRTGGSRRKARVRPPVAHFEEHFTPKATAPEPYEIESLGQHAAEKGFVDALTTQAQCVLEKIGYQHASSYFDMFKRSDGTFSPDATMKLLHRLILFDRKYEALLMEHIGLFELQFRARYAYFMSLKRGAFAHRNPKNFKNQDYFRSFLKNYQREFNRQLSNRNGDMIRAYEMYGDAPIWLAVEAMSFGTLSKLYSNTKSKEVRAEVAAGFGASPEELESWIRALSSVRNTCAHFGRLCGTKLVRRPKKIPGIDLDNASPFYPVLLLGYMARDWPLFADDTTLAYSLSLLIDVSQLFFDFSDIYELTGLPDNWASILFSNHIINNGPALSNEFFQFDKDSGKVWFRIRSDDGEIVEVGKSKKL